MLIITNNKLLTLLLRMIKTKSFFSKNKVTGAKTPGPYAHLLVCRRFVEISLCFVLFLSLKSRVCCVSCELNSALQSTKSSITHLLVCPRFIDITLFFVLLSLKF